MSVARAAGMPAYGSSSAAGFIPAIWSGKLVTKFYASTVFAAISNTDYEGEISSKGDKVIIRTVPTMTIRDYEIGTNLNYEKPVSEKVELLIDRAKYFSFEVNDVDKYQSDLNLMDDWSDDAGEQMKIAIDTDVLSTVYADAAAENQGATAGKISGAFNLGTAGAPVELTKDSIIDAIVDLGTVLDEQNVPESGRFLVLPAWACGMIKKSEIKDASLAGDDTSIVRNGRLGQVDRFTIYNSNNVAHVAEGDKRAAHIIAGHKSGLTFASQMTNMETLPNPQDFGKLVRGLNVYGFKVIKGESLAHLYAVRG